MEDHILEPISPDLLGNATDSFGFDDFLALEKREDQKE